VGEGEIKLTLTTSTGTTIVVWRDRDVFCARRGGVAAEPEMCLPVDLFEVIAELGGLDLESESGAAEAVRLADYALEQLRGEGSGDPSGQSGRRSG
jgi:hypothetical protein